LEAALGYQQVSDDSLVAQGTCVLTKSSQRYSSCISCLDLESARIKCFLLFCFVFNISMYWAEVKYCWEYTSGLTMSYSCLFAVKLKSSHYSFCVSYFYSSVIKYLTWTT
jgi:hypothetical protein